MHTYIHTNTMLWILKGYVGCYNAPPVTTCMYVSPVKYWLVYADGCNVCGHAFACVHVYVRPCCTTLHHVLVITEPTHQFDKNSCHCFAWITYQKSVKMYHYTISTEAWLMNSLIRAIYTYHVDIYTQKHIYFYTKARCPLCTFGLWFFRKAISNKANGRESEREWQSEREREEGCQ